jgi:D-arginine dehydrogenase
LAALHEPGAMAIDVDLLQQEYLRRARSHGATVRTNARVTGIRHDGQWHLTIDGTTVRCSHVVNAAGAWADEVAIMAGLRPIGRSGRPMNWFTREATAIPASGMQSALATTTAFRSNPGIASISYTPLLAAGTPT